MRSFLKLKFLLRIFLFIWCISFLSLITYGFLLQKQTLALDNNLLSLLVEISLSTAIVYLFLFFLQLIGLKKLLLMALLLGFTFYLIYFVINSIAQIASIETGQPRKKPLPPSIRLLADARQFYLDLFFDAFGYPPDQNMSTAKELFEAVNQYRRARALASLLEHSSLCQIAQADFQALYPFISTKNYALVKLFEQREGFAKMGEIIQTAPHPNIGKHIVNVRWARSFSQQKEILEDPEWRFGCGAVSEYNVTFVFGKY